MHNIDRLSRNFLNFAERECKGSSLLYEYLSIKIANDNCLLEISSNAQKGQPIPNLLFGAVHYLLQKGQKHPLKKYYPSIVNHPKPYNESFDHFKDFCLEHRIEIEAILKSRLVQTNEVRRCAYLYPVFCTIYELANKPLALIEIGTSAGLQLLWDQYAYSYGQQDVYGNTEAKLHITAEIKGDKRPVLHLTPPLPQVTTRLGLDLNTIDLNDEDEKLWLKSLIWPEHKERLHMFEQAANYLQNNSVKLVEGDGLRLLPKYVKDIPEESVICVFHTHVANQMPPDLRNQLIQTIETIGQERDIFHIYNNIYDGHLHLDYILDGMMHQHTIAETDGHGRWFKWLLKSEKTM
ncbi:DUF2332 domain-containing protein [Sporosarcina ureilytica]|uniref:DUF2332 domain-containing protein n=1 Tax=Sporosarcina ureilytica TaxID=298596 RepID=A0A1D8JGC2_9BACL|nr:DUF2332 domain-containing protein [Sporosarcina ureilytica]AOV07746.1 hypothetical protein BI350_09530 [Sporosarcina ureilytica]